MKILSITAGAANMYCGSCLRDNALAAELIRKGHDVTLLPIYTPTRTDEPNVSEGKVLYNGINVYLQQVVPFFRYTPSFVDRAFESNWLMGVVSKFSMKTDPADLGALTVSTLKGEEGFQRKEVKKLIDWIDGQDKPDIIVLPNSLMIGFARPLAKSLGVPIVCTLQGEDLFLDGLTSRYRSEAVALIQKQVRYVDVFTAVSNYYARFMSEFLEIPSDKMAVVPLGINMADYNEKITTAGPLRIGYFARIVPEKGLHNLAEAYCLMRKISGLPETQMHVAGYLEGKHQGYLAEVKDMMRRAGLSDEFVYHGVLNRGQKIDFLESLSLMSVPSEYEEPKGLFLLEAMAAGVPVVQPRRGAFPEIVEQTSGGRIVKAGDNAQLADALAKLVIDEEERVKLSRSAAEGVRKYYKVSHMADEAVAVFSRLVNQN